MAITDLQVLPALPLKNTILFPGLLLPLSVGRESSLQAVQAALKTEEKEIILIAQMTLEHLQSIICIGRSPRPLFSNKRDIG